MSSAHVPILASGHSNARAAGLVAVAAALSEPKKQKRGDRTANGFGVQTFHAALGWSINLACVLASLVSRSLTQLLQKWKKATSSSWFPLVCAGASFAVLLLLTGAFAGVALTKQTGRTNKTAEQWSEAITSRGKSQPMEPIHDSDLIAILIDLTSREERKKERSAPAAVPLLPPRILLDARSFATVPVE